MINDFLNVIYTMPNGSNTLGGGVRRIIFTNKATGRMDNRYIVGAGVGPLNASVRRALKRRASNNAQGKPCPCSVAPGVPVTAVALRLWKNDGAEDGAIPVPSSATRLVSFPHAGGFTGVRGIGPQTAHEVFSPNVGNPPCTFGANTTEQITVTYYLNIPQEQNLLDDIVAVSMWPGPTKLYTPGAPLNCATSAQFFKLSAQNAVGSSIGDYYGQIQSIQEITI
jgi:hypothetical protein